MTGHNICGLPPDYKVGKVFVVGAPAAAPAQYTARLTCLLCSLASNHAISNRLEHSIFSICPSILQSITHTATHLSSYLHMYLFNNSSSPSYIQIITYLYNKLIIHVAIQLKILRFPVVFLSLSRRILICSSTIGYICLLVNRPTSQFAFYDPVLAFHTLCYRLNTTL